MARLLYTEDGKQVIRNFQWIRTMSPDGRMSAPREFHGMLILDTGPATSVGRMLLLVQESTPKHALIRYAAVFVLGAFAMAVYTASVATF